MEETKGVVLVTNEEKILEMLTKISSRLDSLESEVKESHEKLESEIKEVHKKVDALTESQEALAESQSELRASVNAILEWTETVSAVVPMVPPI